MQSAQPNRSALPRTAMPHSRNRAALLCASALVYAVSTAVPGLADPMVGASRNTYGMPGLIDMPTAEGFSDGTLGVSITALGGGTLRNTLTFQIAPHVTGAFRYSRVPDLMPIPDGSGGISGYKELYDRSFDIRWQVLEEGRYTPALAVGLNDMVGTSVYSSEYIVATKGFGSALRVTAGVGWGRLGSFGSIGSTGTRPVYDYNSNGGEFNSGAWFRGDVAPFFGVSYKFNDRLTLKAEYSSDAYVQETRLSDWEHQSAVNVGLDYKLGAATNLQMFYLHGDKIGFQFSYAIDPKRPAYPTGLESAPLPVRPRPAQSADVDGWSGAWTADPTAQPAIQGAIAQALAKDGQILESMSLTATRAELRVRNETYNAAPQAVGRVARIATRALPSSVETITVTLMEKGMAVSSVTVTRSDLERLENGRSGDILSVAQITEAGKDPTQVVTEGLFPRFQWSLRPYLEASYFDPDSPLRADVGLSLKARYDLGSGFVLSGDLRQTLLGNLDQSDRVSTSTAPHVRSDSSEYQKNGDLALHRLTFAHYGRPAENLYSRLTVGYLERMYGGISGELLWKPVDNRLALGVEANWVTKRDYDQRFGFQDYDVATGHASAYYDFGGGYTGELDLGRYLAKDWGATISLAREFSNGWQVGAFATVTDMSSADFGEGSFDKGIRITAPIAWLSGKPSRASMSTVLRPLQRDGGARLDVDGRLYETVRSDHMGALYENWGRFWR
ncbi:exopolysaccharide biosynthesis protein YbjH [Rhodobacter aestuarii]|uniref:Exopolysaccharide biosynthesis protein YbjH n=1 Tax=Rhodobacter aestuarii TaxID=453582 RepID=A0A1N7PAQ7_9RHOB|nr:YjbH domain-containing protein [Rhodobacter aestuarii]PTV97710.1 exopolysaccharide biosynthesis protein YbjH [Rhodobacter aestuarii]SIT07702.1 Exopolysaccharide biosynthesis protein YbjH [Rhodobacter aestuarii]